MSDTDATELAKYRGIVRDYEERIIPLAKDEYAALEAENERLTKALDEALVRGRKLGQRTEQQRDEIAFLEAKVARLTGFVRVASIALSGTNEIAEKALAFIEGNKG